jgi:radical SAM protein with 4Fe4S-binding SPASM domain
MKTEEVFHILDQVAEAGCLWLLITGGEPLLRKDFLDIYTYAKKKGFITTLFTNGTLITPEIADGLADWPPFFVEITLYGATKETYERVTRTPGSFERCQRGIDLLLDREMPLGLKTMVTTFNHEEIHQIKAYADELGVSFRFDPLINPRLDGSKRPCKFRLPPEEVVELDRADTERTKAWQKLCKESIRPFSSDHLFICGAGLSTYHIDPYGLMSACEMARFQAYDLRQGTFEEGWRKSIPQLLALKPEGRYSCGRCELISLCAQCPGWAWLESGHPEAPVQYLCQIAQLRAEAFNTRRI